MEKLAKAFSIVFLVFIAVQFSYAQKTMVNFNVYSGLFFFRGNGAAKNTRIFSAPFYSPGTVTVNPYGKRSGPSYAFELQLQQLTKSKYVYGLGVSFETLASKVNIDSVVQEGEIIYAQPHPAHPASGKTILKNSFITFNPFAGYRYRYRKIYFDLTAGVDVSFCLKSRESGNATYVDMNNTYAVATSNEMAKPSVDFRPRLQIKTGYNKWGFIAGYSLGLTNYKTGSDKKAYSDFLRLGLSYQLK